MTSLKTSKLIFPDIQSESDFQLLSSKESFRNTTFDFQIPKETARINNKRFLFELRKAFDDADSEQKGWVSHDQWMNSSLRYYIHDGRLTEDEFDKYFRKIDANSDERLTWEELVCYMIQEITTRELKLDNDAARLITKVPTQVPKRSNQHRDMVRRLIISKRTGEYLTLSDDSIRIWYPTDLSLKHSITSPGYFADFYLFENNLIMVVATTERRLLFYETEKYSVLPVELCASPSTKSIRTMSVDEAQDTLKALESPQIPMFNVPKAVHEADYPGKDKRTIAFVIGDDEGVIELFLLWIPQRRKGNDYKVERISRSQIHSQPINEIKSIDLLNCFASSSTDRTVKFWSFNGSTFSILKTFSDFIPIDGFLFSESSKSLITYGPSRDVYVWGINPPRKIFTLGDHYNQVQCISDFATSSKDKYLVVITNRKEFRIWDSSSFRLVGEWSDTSLQRPENLFSVAQFDHARLCLVTCSAYPTKWAEDYTTQLLYFDKLTHNYPIIGCFYSKDYDQLITCDSACTFKIWNYMKGSLETSHRKKLAIGSSHIFAACLDNSSRRLITTTFNGQITIWNFNSGQEIVRFTPVDHSLISLLMCAVISNREYLVCCYWDRRILLYIEVGPCEYELYRSFNGHKSDITSIAQSLNGLVSGDASGSVISWAINTSSPQGVGSIQSDASIECLACANYCVFAGDSNGTISVFSLPNMNLVQTFDAHGITRPYSLTSITADAANDALYTADSFGYVKKFQLSNLDNGQLFRCHQDDISSLTIINDGRHIATCGIDKTVRIWDTECFSYYGFLYDEEGSHWNLSEGQIDNDQIVKFRGKLNPPFEIDQQHFVQKKLKKPSKLMPATREMMMKSMRRLSIMKMSKISLRSSRTQDPATKSFVAKDKNNNNMIIPELPCFEQPIEEESFSFKKFSETIDEFMQTMNDRELKKDFDMETDDLDSNADLKSSSMYHHERQLQTTTRPTELINQFKSLCSKSYRGETGKLIVSSSAKPSNSVTAHLKNLEVDILKPTKRPPRISQKNAMQSNATFNSDRLPLSLNIV